MERLILTFKDHPPWGRKGFEEGHAGKLGVILVVFIQTKHQRLDGVVGKAIGSSGEHIGDAWVHTVVVARVCAQITVVRLWANDVQKVVTVHNDLK